MKKIKRKNYLEKLRQLRDKKIIKVITGVRRCGKSTLLELFRDELIENGVRPEQIRSINFEKAENLPLTDWKKLHDDISEKLLLNEKNYIFLDEIQNVSGWEKMVDSLHTKDNVDLYLTGSNAYFLSSEFATILSGRQMEIKILPFSFAEYQQMRQNEAPIDRQAIFMEYLRHGGMPQSVEMFNESESLGIDYLTGIYTTVVLNDILTRQGINDSEALENILKFVFDSIGKLLSPKKIADYMASNYRKISSRTVESYLTATTEAFILYGTDRFDIKGKELLQTQQKYYLVDTGLRHVLLAKSEQFNSGRALENVVYLELLRRDYQVWIGKTKSGKEVDFVAKNKMGILEYYQVTETMRGEETRERELSALRNIDDNNRKIILTLDLESNNYAGIEQVNVIDWLVKE
jgi:predicted AAA+ superfamily ATPase